MIAMDLTTITASATVTNGKLDSLVRHVAATARPVSAPSKKLGAFVRNHYKTQRNSAPKQSGDSTSLFIA